MEQTSSLSQMCFNSIQGNLIGEMSKNFIRRLSYLCAPLTWTPRIICSDLPRYLSRGEGTWREELLATQLDKWILWPREVAEVVKLDVIQQKLGYTWERSCPNHSPSPARLCHFLLDGIDHISWATLSSGVTGHLGTTQVRITEWGQTFHM